MACAKSNDGKHVPRMKGGFICDLCGQWIMDEKPEDIDRTQVGSGDQVFSERKRNLPTQPGLLLPGQLVP